MPLDPQRILTSHPFANDTGEVEPAMATALDHEGFAPRYAAVIEALRGGRVLVPVLAHAHPGRTSDGGVASHASQKSGDAEADACEQAAMIAVETMDGRAAMPIFSSLSALQAWDASARPVPVHAQNAAIAAVAEADSLLVLDPGSPRPMLLGRPAVRALATDEAWTPPWEDPELPSLVTQALSGIPHLGGIKLEPGYQAEVRVVVAVPAGIDRAEIATSLEQAQQRLASSESVVHRIDSLELAPQQVLQA